MHILCLSFPKKKHPRVFSRRAFQLLSLFDMILRMLSIYICMCVWECVCVCTYVVRLFTYIHMYIYNAKLWWCFNWYFWCNMYEHSKSFVHKYISISICMCVHIILQLSWLFLFTFFSLLLCLPFIVTLFLLRAHIGGKIWQSSNTIYDTILILFVNLNYLSLLCSNAASHQRTKSLRTMPSIRFQSASKSAHTCSSRKIKKIHSNIHTYTNQQQQQQRAQHWQLLSHTTTHTHTLTQQKLQRTPFEEWAPPPPTRTKLRNPLASRGFRNYLNIDSRYRYLYTLVHKRQTDGQSEITHRDKQTHTHTHAHTITWKTQLCQPWSVRQVHSIQFYSLHFIY